MNIAIIEVQASFHTPTIECDDGQMKRWKLCHSVL